MLDKLSARQKARASLAVLNMSKEERIALDQLVDDLIGNPLIGIVIGIDARTAEELLELYFDSESDLDDEVFLQVRMKLSNPKFRRAIADGVYRFLNTMSETNQKHAVKLITRLSEMDFPELDREFDDVKHFIADGLLVLAAKEPSPKDENDEDIFTVCPNCSHGFSI